MLSLCMFPLSCAGSSLQPCKGTDTPKTAKHREEQSAAWGRHSGQWSAVKSTLSAPDKPVPLPLFIATFCKFRGKLKGCTQLKIEQGSPLSLPSP